jgi:hypothetical protein
MFHGFGSTEQDTPELLQQPALKRAQPAAPVMQGHGFDIAGPLAKRLAGRQVNI